MINSRNVKDLLPPVAALAQKLIDNCEKEGIDLILTSTFRDFEAQASLFEQGRTKPGQVVTCARAGQSYHNYRLAFDVCPIVNGKANWNDMVLWRKIGVLGEELGLEWAWRWKSNQEMAHFQFTGGLRIADLQAGKQPTFA